MAGTVITERRPKPKLITLDTVEARDIVWLWYPYFPQGTVTAIFGRGGMGKSYMTAAIASMLSNGQALPGSEDRPHAPMRVLILSAEDDYETVLVPRLVKQGADLRNIAVPDIQFTLDKQGAEDVRDLMREFAATIVFIDPIVFYAGGKMDMNRSNEVREMMERLKETAKETGSSVIIVGHIKKSEEGAEQDRMMGSADWVNAARSGILVTKTNDGTSIMKHVKTNYGQHGPSRSFYIDDNGFEWGEVYDEEQLPTSTRGQRRDLAVAFLRDLLAVGPVPATEVMDRAKDEGISSATLNRAKVGVAESVYSKTAGMVWRLIPPTEQ